MIAIDTNRILGSIIGEIHDQFNMEKLKSILK